MAWMINIIFILFPITKYTKINDFISPSQLDLTAGPRNKRRLFAFHWYHTITQELLVQITCDFVCSKCIYFLVAKLEWFGCSLRFSK